MNRYVLVKGQDGQIWVPIQALMEDVKESCHKIENISEDLYNSMDDKDKEVFWLKVKGLDTIYSFLGSLLVEYQLKNMSDEQKALHNVNEEIAKASGITIVH